MEGKLHEKEEAWVDRMHQHDVCRLGHKKEYTKKGRKLGVLCPKTRSDIPIYKIWIPATSWVTPSLQMLALLIALEWMAFGLSTASGLVGRR